MRAKCGWATLRPNLTGRPKRRKRRRPTRYSFREARYFMRLLLVEDDTMIGEIVLDQLRSEHYAVDWVKDGEMAEMALLGESYDLVLLDLGLPRKDGLMVLRAMREREDRT